MRACVRACVRACMSCGGGVPDNIDSRFVAGNLKQ